MNVKCCDGPYLSQLLVFLFLGLHHVRLQQPCLQLPPPLVVQQGLLQKPNHNMSTCVDFAANPITTCHHVSSQLQTQSQHANMCTFLLLLLYTPNHNMSTRADFCCCCPAGLAANPTTTRQHVSILPITEFQHTDFCYRVCSKPNHISTHRFL